MERNYYHEAKKTQRAALIVVFGSCIYAVLFVNALCYLVFQLTKFIIRFIVG